MNGTNTLSISDLRKEAAKAVRDVYISKQPTIIFQRSQPKAVLVDYEYYQAMEEAIMDLTDAKEMDKAKKEPRISFETYLKKRLVIK